MSIDMERVDPELNMDRYYYVEQVKDLFGEHGVHRQWGRRGTSGQHLFKWYDTVLYQRPMDLTLCASHGAFDVIQCHQLPGRY